MTEMKRLLLVVAMALVLVLAISAPAFAVSGSDGAGQDFALTHVVHHAQEIGFTGTENLGVHHKGFSGWPPAD